MTSQNFINGLEYAQVIFILLSTIALVYLSVRYKVTGLYIIFPVYCILSFLTTLIVFCRSGNIQVNLFTVFEFFLFSFYISKLVSSKISKIYYAISTATFSALVAYVTIYSNLQKLQPAIIVAENILLSVYCAIYFYDFFNKITLLHPRTNIDFWIIAGMLFYFSVTTTYYLLWKTMTLDIQRFLYSINALGNLVMHLFIIKGFLCFQMKK